MKVFWGTWTVPVTTYGLQYYTLKDFEESRRKENYERLVRQQDVMRHEMLKQGY